MWTSSMTYIRYLLDEGMYRMLSLSSLISSIPRLEAPSISWTSTEDPSVISMQDRHRLQGIPGSPSSQLMALAKIRATEVFPTPLGPLKR